MRTYFRWVFWVTMLAISVPMQLYAACQIVGTTPDGGYIIVCDGPDTIGLACGDGSDIITINTGVPVSKTDMQSVDVTATANATTIDAGGGNNQVTNNGSIGATADAEALPVDGSASRAAATTTAIKTGDNLDVIQNFSTITSTATSNSESGAIFMVPDLFDLFHGATSEATAKGMDAGSDDDQIVNTGRIDAAANASANLTDILLPPLGSKTLGLPPRATAHSTGIDGGVGNDGITNSGTVYATAVSSSKSVGISLTLDLEGGAASEATAVGINGNQGDDQITSTTEIKAEATANAGSDSVVLNLLSIGTYATPTTATASSTGIDSGAGKDEIKNSGTITTHATSSAKALSVTVSALQYEVTSHGDARTESVAIATGISVGEGDDKVTNTGTVTATANATASTTDISVEYTGAARGNSSTTSDAFATGIDGGVAKDDLSNSSAITVNATSEVQSLSIEVKRNEIPLDPLAWFGADLDDARTAAQATAIGIDGGDGDDTITNSGTIDVHAYAKASSADIVAEVSIPLKSDSKTPKASKSNIDLEAPLTLGAAGITARVAAEAQENSQGGNAIANAGTFARVTATGIAGGAGNDTIANHNKVSVKAESEAASLSIGVTISYERSEYLDILGLISITDTTTTAQATAAGVGGGAGNDTITNTNELSAEANSNATSTAIKAHLQGDFKKDEEGGFEHEIGASLVECGTESTAMATGIAGEDGNDSILNSGKVIAKAVSGADSTSVATALVGAGEGLVAGFSYANATTTAQATATGIDGGTGNNSLNNKGEIEVTAGSTSASISVGVTVTGVTKDKGMAASVALTDGTTKAISTAAGMKGADGADTITSSGKIKATATSDADSTSISASIAGTKEGLAVGVTYADATTTAEATAIGIDGGAGNDIITNLGESEVTAVPTSSSASIGVTVSGGFSQEWSAAVGVAIADGTTKAISHATGISGADGEDTITNFGKITAKALPDADSASVSVGVVGAEDGLTLGVTYADTTTTAEANAVGIEGGAGNDIITNASTGQIEVMADPTSSSASVSATITGVTKGTGIVGGAALTDGTTKAISNIAGVRGGQGDDTITNAGRIIVKSNPDADSASVSMNLGAALGELGLVGGFSYADATTTAQGTAIGIEGGAGNDAITNTGEIEVTTEPTASSASIGLTAQGVKGMGAAVGISLTDGTTKAISTATGIDGGEGDDTITNSGKITVRALPDADSASVSVSLSAAKEGVAAGGTFADTTTTAQATAAGIEGGEGKDTITNSGTIEVTADSEGSSASVSFSAQGTMTGATLGIALTDGTTKAISTATGITGGGGDDTITNSYITKVTSTADVAAASVSVNAGIAVDGAAVGAALADGKTVATSSAIGLEGGAGNDTLTNRGSNKVSATSGVTAASVAVSLEGTRAGLAAGISLVDGENRASALAIGIRGGDGNDTIGNYETTWVDAITTSVRTNVSVTGTFSLYGAALGASAADATNIAAADARGIEGGEGNDTITNTSNLVMGATTSADTTSVSVSANVAIFGAGAGASLASAETTGSALATGIDGGEGDNTIKNTSSGYINATSTAHAHTVSVGVNLIGAVKASADSTATATSTGMTGGKGTDFIQNDGTVTLSATSDTDASSYAAQLVGYGESNAKGISNAMVKGIDGGEGSNTMIITSTGAITGTATALADANSYDIQLSGGGKATAGTVATATAIGIAGGKEMDTIRNEGKINLTAGSTLVSESRSYKIFGIGLADADSKAETIATGIDGGEGPNIIANVSTGSITVSSNASATATSLTVNIGVAGSSASTTSNAHSTGMKSGKDQDTILNEGNISVTATSTTGAGGGGFSLVGLSFGDSLTEASTDGVNAGGGNDTIINKGSITVGSVQDNDHPMAYSEVASVSFSFFGISSATFGSKAQATGIIGGSGDDTILNAGTITVGDDNWMAKGWAYGFSGNFFEFFSLTSVGAAAESVSTGVEGGDGNDTLLNDSSGVLNVKTTSYARTEGAADTPTFGNPAVFASSTTKATATGINGGEGDDLIENRGAIDVDTHTLADAYCDSWVGWGEPSADSTANATAIASGIDAGKGQNFVTNSGVINVKALAETTPYAKADSNVDTTDAETTSYSKSIAFGILAGDDGNIVSNTTTGAITVTATARTYDAQGNIAKAESDEKSTVIAGSVNTPITADAVGISLGKGDDTVTNNGTITASSLSDARVSAYTNSWPYDARSDATAYAAAIAKGIAAGVGANEVINNGQINVSAWSHANPITDSWSRDQTATANAVADSRATANGIEADGNITNGLNGSITVTARVTTYADANTNAETTTATATLMATATGIRTVSSTGGAVPDRILNDGIITVNALAGEDENGNPKTIALADTDIDVRSDRAEATGTSTADAMGIRVGDNDAVFLNNGNLTVLGRARAYLSADAFSRDYNPTANAHSNAIATGVGIQAGGGSNAIRNSSLIDVDALAEARAQGWADSWSSRTYTNIYGGSIANGAGISVGDGDNLIVNEDSGVIDVNSDATGITYSSSDENANAFIGVDNNTVVASNGMGIQAGQGNNVITNRGQITVRSEGDANSHANASSVTFTATATSKTGALSDATGIKVGDGKNTIRNNGPLTVTAANTGKALSDFPSSHLDWALAYAGAGDTSLTSNATGISAGDGVNLIECHNTILVTSTLSADAQAYANTSTSTNHGEAYAGGMAKAAGILVGNGQNRIKTYGDMIVRAKADTYALGHAEDYGYAYIGSESAPGVRAEAIGISAGNGINEISNYGTLEVNATATAYSRGRAHTTSVDAHGRAIANSYATATGIRTGDGINTITNYGTINVSALGDATAVTDVYSTHNDEFRYAYQSTDTSAVGIQTGTGNDIIINSGSITTANQRIEWVGGWIHITSQPGIAIASGAGNDTVILTEGSYTGGSIELGDGDDTLKFIGTATVTREINPGAGSNSLIFEGSGNLGYNFQGFENTMKQGPGTFTLASLPTMKRLEVRQGTLQINSNYAMAHDSAFQAFVNGDGSHGQLKVNGTTELAGDLSVLKGPGPYKNGTTYNIIEADAVNNTFSNVMLPPPNSFVSFGMHQFPTLVQIEVYAKDFAWLVRNRVEWAVANYLDRIFPSATGDLFGMFGQIQSLSQSGYSTALTSLSPDSYDNFTRNTFSTTHRYTKSLQYRINNVRSYSHASQPGNEIPILLAYRGSDVGELYNLERVSQIQGKNGLWFDAFGQWGDQEGKDGYTGYDYFLRGATLGFDRALNDKFMAGVSIGYSRSDIDLDQDQGSGYIKSLYGSIYGSYFNKNLYIDTILSYGKNWYDNHRLITIGAGHRKAYSEHDGDLFSAYLQGGYYFDIKKWLIGPFASLQYVYLNEESFREKGAGGVSLNINGRKTDSLVSELGVRLARVFRTEYGSFIPEVSAAWLHDFDIDDRVVTSSFAGSPGASFSIRGQDVERNGATLGAGITFIHKSGLSTSLKYIGDFREKYKSNGVMGEIRYAF